MNIIKRLIAYAWKYRGMAVAAISLLILFILMNMISPMITKSVIDDVIRGGNRSILPKLLLAILVISICKGILIYSRAFCFEKVSQNCLFDLRNQLYRHLQRQSFTYFDNNRVGELMSRMTGDLEGIRVFIVAGIPVLLENAIYLTGTIIILMSMNAELALISLVMSPFIAWAARRFDKKIRPVYSEIREQQAVLNTTAQENIAGVRVVKAFARENYEIEKFMKENEKNRDNNIHASFVSSKFSPIMDFLSGLSSVIVLWYGGRMVANGEISLGTLVAFNSYLWMLINPMRMLSWMVNIMEHAVSSGERVFNILDTGSIVKNKENPFKPEEAQGNVKFNDVCFYYKDQQVLFHINIDVPAGKTIAIMGATGSGKTSIINLLSRFYDVSSGKVLVDGVDVRNWDLDALRDQIGIIMQDTFLFSATIEENIQYGKPEASREEVIQAARIASAHDFIMEMPEGYDTIVGERGMGLSGGQKQRIAIARAVIKNPKILVMDDCTSAVDMETEYEIQQALKTVMEGRTTFIIAHRISSVKDADEIIVLDKGRIAERGSHQQLLRQRGKYYEIYIQQFKDFGEDEKKRQVM